MVPDPDGAEPPALLAGTGLDDVAGWPSGTACTDGEVGLVCVDVPREANQAIETTRTTAATPAMRSIALRDREGAGVGDGSAGGGAGSSRASGALHW
jgi:hypothetical protein